MWKNAFFHKTSKKNIKQKNALFFQFVKCIFIFFLDPWGVKWKKIPKKLLKITVFFYIMYPIKWKRLNYIMDEKYNSIRQKRKKKMHKKGLFLSPFFFVFYRRMRGVHEFSTVDNHYNPPSTLILGFNILAVHLSKNIMDKNLISLIIQKKQNVCQNIFQT